MDIWNHSSAVALYSHPSQRDYANKLIKKYNLLTNTPLNAEFKLYCSPERLELHSLDNQTGPIYVDFITGKNAYRQQHGGGLQQTIAKAIGIKGSKKPSIIDATAGFGKDSFVLASLGCKVTLLERSAVFAALLEDGIYRANLVLDSSIALQNMQLIHVDSREYLGNESIDIDVIYLDPMYPKRNKTALVKKEMQVAQRLIGDDIDAAELLEVAIKSAKQRVVVKRPRGADLLSDLKPSFELSSKNTRYDVYLAKI